MALQIPCVGAVLIDDQGRFLLVRRANPPAQGLWSLPGGRVEPGETHEQAVVREMAEETGLAVRIVREVGIIERDAPGGGRYVIRDYLVHADSLAGMAAGDDAAQVALMPLSGPAAPADAELSPGLREALASWGLLG